MVRVFISPFTFVLNTFLSTVPSILFVCCINNAKLIRRLSIRLCRFLPSSDISSIYKSDLVVICSGLFATKEEKLKIGASDEYGRSVQSIKNYCLITDICKQIKDSSPFANILVVTNQADVMSARAREIIPDKNIYGLGCYLDTIRFKNIFTKEAGLYGINIDLDSVKATLLGFHNKNVFLDENNFSVSHHIENINELIRVSMEKTIARGKEISDMQKDVHLPNVNSGSSKLPAAAIYNIIAAFTQPQKSLEIPLNRLLTEDELCDIGEASPVAAQFYCGISQNIIQPITTRLSPKNIDDLRKGIKEISFEISKLKKNNRLSVSIKER